MFRFFYDFKELAANAGHSTAVTAVVQVSLLEELEANIQPSIVVERLLAAPDLTKEELEGVDGLRDRVYSNRATETDKWAFQKVL
jgi:hypothetical protein